MNREDLGLLRRIAVVAVPSYPLMLLARSVGLVSTAMIGKHASDSALAAVGLANVVTNITGYSMCAGLATGIRTLSAQDWGAGNYHAIGDTIQRSLAILMIVCALPLGIFWLFSEQVCIAVGQRPDVARYVGLYTRVRCIGLLFIPVNCVLTQTLASFSNVHISMVMGVSAGILNIILSLTLIPKFGYIGAPLTATITDVLESTGLLLLCSCNKDFRKCWSGFSWRAAFSGWGRFLRVACPSLVLMGIEWWTWDLQSFIAGYINKLAQEVQSVTPAVGDVEYSVGQSIGNGAATAVGNLLGEGKATAAKRASLLTMLVVLLVMSIQLAFFLIFKHDLAQLFTNKPEVLQRIEELLPLSLLFSFIDGHQAAITGVLQGAGKQHIGAGIVFFCYWVVGVPIGIMLAFGVFGKRFDVEGLWYGMIIAVAGHLTLFTITICRFDWAAIAQEVQARVAEEAATQQASVSLAGFPDGVEEEPSLHGGADAKGAVADDALRSS